jgi:Ca-activated chloride channel family protein
MNRHLLTVVVLLACSAGVQAQGLLIPEDKTLPPLAMLNHHVRVTIDEQVAITRVEQTFRNHTSRPLEATYVFPVPRHASVSKLAMWIGGKEVKGELVKADKARQIYNDIVRQTRDPALLEYIGSDLLRLRVFPIPPHADQKLSLSYTSIARKDHDLVEYIYPLKTDTRATRTLEDFTLQVELKSKDPILNVYSPTHTITLKRVNDQEVKVEFAKNQALLNKDFQLFYTTSTKDVGLTTLLHRPVASEDGYVLLLVSPRAELVKEQQVPRDLVFVLDTSGSMREDGKMEQAKKALQHCLGELSEMDRFGLITFATTVNQYRDGLVPVNNDQTTAASKWIDDLSASGGTAIEAALDSALQMRTDKEGRTFTVVFFTDGQPTIGETDTDKIVAQLGKKNTSNTRIFTFGVGYDLNAALLDQIAEHTRAASSYVKPEENLLTKVTSFFGKITHPVLANLKLSVGEGVRLVEVYPPELPDLFHGDQLVVLGRYQGSGHKAVTLTGTVGMDKKEFVYETEFKAKAEGRFFVEELWARRKVGYLLDQIRLNGTKDELVAEVTALAKKYGITTPYTSHLIIPDAPVPVAQRQAIDVALTRDAEAPAALQPAKPGGKAVRLEEFAKRAQQKPGELSETRGIYEDEVIRKLEKDRDGLDARRRILLDALDQKKTQDMAYANIAAGRWKANQVEKLGVDLAVCTNNLKCQQQLTPNALRNVNNRTCLEIGGVWVDEGFTPKTPTLVVKAQSDAYFRILERQPQMRDVFRLGNHVVWIAPNGTGLIIDARDGKDKLSDEEIDKLFIAKK